MRMMIALPAALLALAGPAAAAELLVNGNFETGTYAGWTTGVQAGSSGDIQLDAPGTTTPIAGFPTPANAAGGNFYSVTDQGGPGAYVLLQSFTVPVGATQVLLSFEQFVQTDAPVSINAAGLDYNAFPNQHARVDILTAAAGAFSTAAADVVSNLYIGIDGTVPRPAYTAYAFDLTALLTPGLTYQLRFGQVDNQGFFNQGVDNVSIDAVVGVVPAPAALGLFGLAFGLVALRRR